MLGWSISLVAHAIAAVCLWHAWLPHRADLDAGPDKRIEVRLVPVAPQAPPPAPLPDKVMPRPSPLPLRPSRGPALQRQALPTIEESEPPAAATPATPADAVDLAGSETNAPTVDLASARATARLIARESGKGLVALPGRKPVLKAQPEAPIVGALERARRVDCQKARAESANLLANVIGLAVDLAKNAYDDSGCKW
ncbi:hypothetical protein [Massilia sp. Bi118]|uniref:hypothetical protein n=1 Tax=Massilia sp. Bi118 TaxID=2822346 RepID=UPI001E41FC66|nr:hypothetical protein [Massilia sp. Bi118]